METRTRTSESSLMDLLRDLKVETQTFIREEIALAKAEISENLARLGRNAAALAVGGFLAYAGLIVLLIGLGFLIAWALEFTGLAPAFAGFLGLSIVGLVIIALGGMLLIKGLSSLTKKPVAPQRTLHTLQELKGASSTAKWKPSTASASATAAAAAKASPDEMQSKVEQTEQRMGETLDELGHRLSPKHINAEIKHKIQARPYRFGVAAMLAGLVSGFFIRRRFRHA